MSGQAFHSYVIQDNPIWIKLKTIAVEEKQLRAETNFGGKSQE